MAKVSTGKKSRFPEGEYTIRDWMERYADEVMVTKVTWNYYYNRVHFNRLSHGQDEYIESLKEKAKNPIYQARRGDVFYKITKADYEWAKEHGIRATGAADSIGSFLAGMF